MSTAIVVSAFPGCGKTYACEHQEELHFRIKDSESSKRSKPDDFMGYVDEIEAAVNSGEYDFIFVSQHKAVREELTRRGIPFCTVAPPGHDAAPSYSKFLLEKQICLNRLTNRDNSHIKDFDKFIQKITDNYDSWTTKDSQMEFGCKFHLTLYSSRHLSDCLGMIKDFWQKNNYFES